MTYKNNLKNLPYTENFKGLRLNLDAFYLVILPLGIWSALIKYHLKPLDMIKI